jgi:flagellar biosynthetic protein FlhB
MAETNGEKSQDATPHRRQQAREEGQVAHSQDLASAGLLLGGLVVLLYLAPPLAEFLGQLMARHLGGEAWLTSDRGFLLSQWQAVLLGLGGVLLPILGLFVVLGAAADLLQFGPLFTPQRVAPDWSRINPLSGFSRLFSLPNFVRLAFGVFKILIVGTVAWLALYHRREEIVGLAGLETMAVATLLWDIGLSTAIKVGVALAVLAILDFGYQWFKHEQDLKMTPQEVREEMRNLQGDPQVIARRRNVQRQLAAHRLTSAVPKADVVVTNPTELAVALQYDPATMNAPIVVAKGAGILAQRIRQLALEHGIPIVEKKPLAQALYRDVDLNKPIPDKLYAGVAEVLAYVYQLKGKELPVA